MTILFFTASWCSVCKAMYPIWNKIVENNTTLDFRTVDCSEDVEEARKYSITRLPAFVVVDEINTPLDSRSGFLSLIEFQKWVDTLK